MEYNEKRERRFVENELYDLINLTFRLEGELDRVRLYGLVEPN